MRTSTAVTLRYSYGDGVAVRKNDYTIPINQVVGDADVPYDAPILVEEININEKTYIKITKTISRSEKIRLKPLNH